MNTKEGSPATTVTDTTAFLAKHADQDFDNAIHVRIIIWIQWKFIYAPEPSRRSTYAAKLYVCLCVRQSVCVCVCSSCSVANSFYGILKSIYVENGPGSSVVCFMWLTVCYCIAWNFCAAHFSRTERSTRKLKLLGETPMHRYFTCKTIVSRWMRSTLRSHYGT